MQLDQKAGETWADKLAAKRAEEKATRENRASTLQKVADELRRLGLKVSPLDIGKNEHLTGRFHFVEGCNHGGQCGVWFECDGWRNRGRVRFSIDWPRDKSGKRHIDTPFDVTISLDKSPERIAKEFVRRFSMQACEKWEATFKTMQADNRYMDECERTTSDIADTLKAAGYNATTFGKTIKGPYTSNEKGDRYGVHVFEGPFQSVGVNRNDVRMSIHCTAEQAKEIIRLLKKR